MAGRSPGKRRLMGWRDWVALGLFAVVPVVEGYLFLVRPGSGGDDRSGAPSASLSLVETLGGADTVGYARALEPRPFAFPADHGPHPDFRSEWWYFTGNLDGSDGRRFGFQFTIFRGALRPPLAQPDTVSGTDWTTDQVYLGHFTVTDPASGSFHVFERYTRGAVGLAGAQGEPLRVWLDDWEVRGVEGGPGEGDGTWPWRLRARDEGVALDLRLVPTRPRVLQGEEGLSRKGPEPGNASYYYSFTRLAAEGTVTLGADTADVTGLAWLDREWSTSALSEGQVGWDWFALQLSDGGDLMVYRLRREDGAVDPRSEGVWVAPDGTVVHLSADDFETEATGSWASAVDEATYPSGWRVRVPGEGLDLRITPVLEDQELDVSFRYWEGAVDVSGTREGRSVTGRGYVELTGYAEQSGGGGRGGGDGR